MKQDEPSNQKGLDIIESMKARFSKSIYECNDSNIPILTRGEESPLRKHKFSNLFGTNKHSESEADVTNNTSPRVIVEEEVTDESDFINAVDKLVSETETLLNSYEKL